MPHRPANLNEYCKRGRYRLRARNREIRDNEIVDIPRSPSPVARELDEDVNLDGIQNVENVENNDCAAGGPIDRNRDPSDDSSEYLASSSESISEAGDELEEDENRRLDHDYLHLRDGYGYDSASDDTEVEDASDEDDEANNTFNDPLYEGCPITVGESTIMIMNFCLSYNLSGKCISHLLELISLHCLHPNNCPKSLFMFKKKFTNLSAPVRRHYYCSVCLTPKNGERHVCNQCNENHGSSYFISLPIIPQVKTMFARPGFHELLNYRSERQKIVEDNVEDSYDGEIYKSYLQDGQFLSQPNCYGMCWNSDGVNLYRSSKYSVWPYFLRWEDLRYNERVKKQNTILAALWFGLKKPLPNMFLLPVLQDLQKLARGVYVRVPQVQNQILVRSMVLYGTCDLPAKALFLNMSQFNGLYGCTNCKQRSERYNNRQVYRFHNNLTLRTDEELNGLAQLALDLREPFQGVKGFSIISSIVERPISGTAIDPMHKYSGIVGKLLEIWLQPHFHEHPASLLAFKEIINVRYCSIKPPSFVDRIPRSFEHLKYFKASEFKSWLFYYSVPILSDVMGPQYFQHYMLLVCGLYILNKNSISHDEINLASRLLQEFVLRYEDLYGLTYMSCNVHQLLHLSEAVKCLGPLWTISCAPFENLNGDFKLYVHGTRCAELQICSAACLFLALSVFKDKNLVPGSAAHSYCEKVSHKNRKLQFSQLTDNISAVGKLSPLRPIPLIIQNALVAVNALGQNVHLFQRAYYNKTIFFAQSYTRATKTNSQCVKFKTNDVGFGLIQSFVCISNCDCNELCECNNRTCYAIVRKYEFQNPFSIQIPRAVLSFIHECQLTNHYIAVNVESFLSLCYHLPLADTNKTYVVEPVNNCETAD